MQGAGKPSGDSAPQVAYKWQRSAHSHLAMQADIILNVQNVHTDPGMSARSPRSVPNWTKVRGFIKQGVSPANQPVTQNQCYSEKHSGCGCTETPLAALCESIQSANTRPLWGGQHASPETRKVRRSKGNHHCSLLMLKRRRENIYIMIKGGMNVKAAKMTKMTKHYYFSLCFM